MKTCALSLLALLCACSPPAAEQASVGPVAAISANTPATPRGDPLEGKRVATRVGCFGCHGEQLQGTKLWGKDGQFQTYSANITEKRALYDDAGFERLLRTGRTHDGHRALGMPILMYQHLSDSEVRDIVALVRSLPAVANPGLKQSWYTASARKQAEGYGDDLGDPVAVGAPALPPADGLALGKHIAMTSCPECHGGDLNGFEGEDAPSLVVAKAYTTENFERLVRTGITGEGKESRTGLMTSVARSRLAPTLSDRELKALKAYLDAR
jgi:mono/diheme cytochrome c family protein